MAQQITSYRTSIPDLTKCKNLECNNLVSNVDQKTRRKEFCSQVCRDKVHNSKSKFINYYYCKNCKWVLKSKAVFLHPKLTEQPFCPDCKTQMRYKPRRNDTGRKVAEMEIVRY